MSKAESKRARRRLINAYLSSIISIGLVLLLVGVAAMLIANAGSVSDYFKETLQISVLMKPEVNEAQAQDYAASLDTLPYIKTEKVISREQGTQELKAMLGDEFLSVFESSPVPVSVELTLEAEYVSSDSLAVILPVLGQSELVDEVSCQQSLVDALNANLARISLVLGVFIILLLFISYVLINNTVRINVFNRRFTIHTMQLVGATRSFIRKPFVKGAVWQGIIAGLVADGALLAILFALKESFASLFEIFRVGMIAAVMVLVIICGVLICVVSTVIVVNKLVESSKDELYY